jgi:putative tricarboxylic transport membrane protein
MRGNLGERHGDRLVGLVALATAAIFFYETLSFRVVAWDPLGLAFWPRVVLALMATFALWFVIRGSVSQDGIEPVLPSAFLVLGGCAAPVVVLPRLGFLISTFAFVLVFAHLLGRGQDRRLAWALGLAVVTTLGVYLVFQQGLGVQLPRARLLG